MPAPEFSRRTLVASIAWTAPVIALAVVAPAASASDSGVQLGFKPSPQLVQQGHYRIDVQPGVESALPGTDRVFSYTLTISFPAPYPDLAFDSYFVDAPEGFSLVGAGYSQATGSYTVQWIDPTVDGLSTNNPYRPYGPNLEAFYNVTSGAAPTSYTATLSATGTAGAVAVVPLT